MSIFPLNFDARLPEDSRSVRGVMTVTAGLVKELREKTNAGMMECKNALVKAQGDINTAIEILQKEGLIKAQKKSSRVNAEGTLSVHIDPAGKRASLVEVNCETDFVAREAKFKTFAENAATEALQGAISDIDVLREKL